MCALPISRYRFGSGEAAAVDVHVQEIGARNHAEKPNHDQRDQRSPDAQLPADQQKQSKDEFSERQGVRDKENAAGREQFVRLHLDAEIRKVRGERKAQREQWPGNEVGEEKFRVTSINKNSTEREAGDPEDPSA